MRRKRYWGRRGVLTGLAFFCCASTAVAADPAVGTRQMALHALAADSVRPLEVSRSPGSAVPYFVTGKIPVGRFSSAATARRRGADFWQAYGAAFGVDDHDDLTLDAVERDALGMTHLRYEQRYRGLRVFGHELVLHLDGGAVTAVNGDFAPALNVPTRPTVAATAAADTARAALAKRAPRPAWSAPEPLVFAARDSASLAWRVTVPTSRPLGLWQVFVDARTGRILRSHDDLHTAKSRSTYTNGNDADCNTAAAPSCTLPGALVRAEEWPAAGDIVVNGAHDHTGTVYDYYSTTFGRDSYDGGGHAIRSTVHFGAGYNNAFWCDDVCAAAFGSSVDGEQMAYGDGDGSAFSPLATDLDVVAHELTHAVTGNEADLDYFEQPGALNESYSDVFAAMVDSDNWLIGEDSFTPGVSGDALRSMSNPAVRGQPAHMSQYRYTIYDNGGVHINSGIPNKTAYLTSEGSGYGIGRAPTQEIYYRALTIYLTPTSDFMANLSALRQSAIDLYGAGSPEVRAVERAHAAVGLVNRPAVVAPNGGETLTGGTPTSVQWSPGGDNGAAFRVQYLQESAPQTYSQGFEAAVLPGEFSPGGDTPWFPDDFLAFSGSRSAGSGPISHNQRSELRLTRTLTAAGNVTFKARVSSEYEYDFFTLWVDGLLRVYRSGEIPWSSVSVPVGAGTHTFVWVYEKDVTVSHGSDGAWIDDLLIPNVESVAATTITAGTGPGASGQPWTPPLVSGSNFKVRVTALGAMPWLATDDSDAAFALKLPRTVSAGDATVTEGNSGGTSMLFPLTLSEAPGPGEQVIVQFETVSGSATAGVDHVAPSSTEIVFGPGETDAAALVPVVGDVLDEVNETFAIHLSSAVGAVIVRDHAIGTILDDDPAPTLRITDASVREGNSGRKSVALVVRLAQASGRTVSVRFATRSGTARAPSDYAARSGLLTFQPGQVAKTVLVSVQGDLRNEPNETFFVKLSNPVAVAISDASGRITIRDND